MIQFNCPECDEPMEISDRSAGKQTDCVNCGVRLVVPEESDAPRGRGRGKRKRRSMPRADLRQIAQYQKGILACILAYLLAIPLRFVVPPALGPVLFIYVALVAIGATVFVFLLAVKLYGTGLGVLLGLLTLIPLIGLITLLVVNAKATATLQLSGYKVGLLGASLSEFD